jgi:hypothetical protein
VTKKTETSVGARKMLKGILSARLVANHMRTNITRKISNPILIEIKLEERM